MSRVPQMRAAGAAARSAAGSAADTAVDKGTGVTAAILKQARASGQLNLSGRQLTSVPDSVWRINIDQPADAPKHISIGGSGAGDGWWEQTDMVKLILASNRLTELVDEVAMLPALQVLDLHDNAIVQVSANIGELQELRSLNLGHNRITQLPAPLCTLSHLATLRLDHNALASLPEELGYLTALDELDLSFNKLQRLPYSLGSCVRLRKLVLNNNDLVAIPSSISQLQQLSELLLEHNQCTCLPAEVQQLTRLTRLDMRHNNLSAIPMLAAAKGLKEMLFGNNCLTTLGDCSALPLDLHILDVRDNKISDVPAELARLSALQRLDLSNNDISTLPPALGDLVHLKSLVLDGNPLRAIRRDVVARGTVEILKHLRSRKVEEAPAAGAASGDRDGMHHSQQQQPRMLGQNPAAVASILDLSNRGGDAALVQYSWPAAGVGVLNVSRNKLSELPVETFQYKSSLTELNASLNSLREVPPLVGLLINLVVLDLRGNQLTALPDEVEMLASLRDIVLSANRFMVLPPVLYTLPKLAAILASDNKITTIDAHALRKMPRLECLDLANNSVDQVPPELGLVEGLKTLKLEGNTFRVPRPDMLAKGTGAVMAFLRSRVA